MKPSPDTAGGLEPPESSDQAIMPSRRSQVKFVTYAAVFAAGGVYVALSGNGAERAVGVFAVVFAIWATIAFWRRFRAHAAIVISDEGMRLPLGGQIAWADIERVGLVKYKRATLVGLWLRSTDRFIASFTEAERAALARNAKGMRVIARGTSMAQLGTFSPTNPGSYDVLVDEDRRSLDELAGDKSLSGVAGTIAFARKQFGCDWTIGALELDRSPAAFVALLNEHLASPERATPV
jgi:hypothetical protein